MAHRGLDHAAVIAAAAALADAEGLEMLTLGALAEKLGIRTPSLYNHVAGLSGLRRDLALLALRQIGEKLGRAAIGKASEQAVFAVMHAYRAYVVEHPGLYAATVRAPEATDVELQAEASHVIEIVLATLGAYALCNDDAFHAVRGLRSIAHGFATLETMGGFGLALDRDESFQRLVQMFINGLDERRTMRSNISE